jgi:Fe-S-cluster containining protein
MTLMEALQWFWIVWQLPETERAVLIRKFVEFYLTNPVRQTGCPFLTAGNCGIYKYRTFACRAYGLWSKEMGQERTQQNCEDKNKLVKLWHRQGIELVPEAIAAEMDYCNQVGCQSDIHISDNQLMAVLQEIYVIDHELADLQAKFENEYYSDFSFLMTSLALSTKKAVLGKLAVINELSRSGTDNRLQNLLAQVKPDKLMQTDGILQSTPIDLRQV